MDRSETIGSKVAAHDPSLERAREDLNSKGLIVQRDRKIPSLIVVGDDRETAGLLHIHHLLEQGLC